MRRLMMISGFICAIGILQQGCEKKTIISHDEYEELISNQDANKIKYMQRTIDSLGIELNKCKKAGAFG